MHLLERWSSPLAFSSPKYPIANWDVWEDLASQTVSCQKCFIYLQPRYHRQQRECVLKSNLLRATKAPAAARHSHNSHCFLSHWQLSLVPVVVTQHCCCHCALSLARRLPLVLRSRLPTTSSAQQRRPDDPRQPGTAGAHNIIKCVFVYICICLFS